MIIKDEPIQIQITAQIKKEFEKAAELRGLNPSAFLHSLIVKAIDEAQRENPKRFQRETQVMTLEEAIADDERKRAQDKKK